MTRSRTIKALILAAGQVGTALVGIIIAATLSRVFTKESYAVYRQTILSYNLAAPLLTLGLPAALYYFIPGEQKRAKGIVFENLILLSLAACVFSIFLLMGGNQFLANYFNNPDLEKTLILFAAFPLFTLPASATTACLMARDRVSQVALYTASASLIKLIIVMTAIWVIGFSPEVAIVALVISSAVVFVISFVVMFRAVQMTSGSVTSLGMKAQMAYSVPLGLGAMIGALHRNIDQLIVSLFTEPETFAVYVNGAMELPLIGVITGSATAVLLPEMRKKIKDGHRKDALKIWKRAGLKTSIFIFPIMGLFLALASETMVLLYSEKYRESGNIFRIYLLLLPIRIVIFGAVFQAAGRTDLIFKRAVIALSSNCVLSFIFASIFPYEYIALATVIVIYAVVLPFCMIKCSAIFGESIRNLFPWKNIICLLLIAAISAIITSALIKGIPPEMVLVKIASGTILYAILFVIFSPIAQICKFDLTKLRTPNKLFIWNTFD